ncbi:MAG: hypothetical protein CMI36_09935 [Owenweeksia sp.]|nr:hypothetical protein [Owenweeksia sp.]MBF99302.1 hypothetical protein [Owenweeksia sp.]HBF21985.1 hypothetical protein [Cryomorphaceae bacterium]HCQ16126.1 hypothetical protein [Cryomorphaceae bacterium]|tara:strand:+ start:6016 stop:7224 length:1209 start_codon:yes stop_codon:yes gene_type:complete
MTSDSGKPMRLYYFAPFDILRSRTNQISDVRFCEGFRQNGFEVKMITPYVYRKDNLDKKRVLDYYGIEDGFSVRYLPTFFLKDISGVFNMALVVALSFLYFLPVLLRHTFKRQEVLVISRSALILYPQLWLKKILKSRIKTVVWVHEVKKHKTYSYVYRHADFILGTNSAITGDIEKLYGVEAGKTGITLNPVSERQLKEELSREEARRKIGISQQPLVVYTGKLFIGQLEARYLLEAARQLPSYTFLFTGGKPEVVEYYKSWCYDNEVGNVLFTGYLHDYRELKNYQYAADILVSYYTEKEHDLRYNLPQKIVEYMLTKNPIVTPEFEATRDVLNAENAIFVEPENIASLVSGIRKAWEDREHAQQLAQRAYSDSRHYSFKQVIATLINPIFNCPKRTTST